MKIKCILKKRLKDIVLVALALCAFLLGSTGLYSINEGSPLDCAYKALQLFFLEYNIDAEKLNIQVEIARWIAPLTTAAVVVNFLFGLIEVLKIFVKTKFMDVIAVHGDSADIDIVLNNLGKKAFHSDKKIAFHANTHILMFREDLTMYRFLNEHSTELFHDNLKRVVMCSEKMVRGSYEDDRFLVCNIAENCARLYWHKNPVINKKEKILLVGFDNYAQHILNQAIKKNVISTSSDIEYHVLGNYHSYLSKHYNLHKALEVNIVEKDGTIRKYNGTNISDNTFSAEEYWNGDKIYFYNMPWYDMLKNAKGFDRIIICFDDDNKNIEMLNELKLNFNIRQCHIKFTDEKIITALWNLEKENIVIFGINHEMYDIDSILKEKLFYKAKLIHATYFKAGCDHKCGKDKCDNDDNSSKVCAGCPEFKKDWNKLSTFLRYSNVAQADHMEDKIRFLLGNDVNLLEKGIGKKVKETINKFNNEQKDNILELEHIRWNRYHFINNWDYAPVRDNENRKHNLLVPFYELCQNDKLIEYKDRDMDAYNNIMDLIP